MHAPWHDDDGRSARAEALEDSLLDAELHSMVDLVLRRTGPTAYVARSADGSVAFCHDATGTTIDEVRGVDPLTNDDAMAFVGAEEEPHGRPLRPHQEHRPHAHDEIAQFFDSPSAPDVVVVHAAEHRYHGNTGEHGSLGTVQRRAPFVAAGPGIRSHGWIDDCRRTVDVAPTVAALGGVAHRTGVDRWGRRRDDLRLGRQDGDEIDTVLDGTSADHVLLVLWDGVNRNALADAVDDGAVPNLAGLIDRGTALRGGILASLPSATLANHTTIGTGALPGHSGILHNEWHDRATGRTHNLLEQQQMFDACEHLAPGVETLHEAMHRTWPDAWTGTTHEYADRGADWSSFAALGRRERLPFARSTDEFPRDGHWWERSDRYRSYSRIDETALRCALDFWADDHPVPRFAFCNFSLTDEAGHEGGPHSDELHAALRDSDERLGRLLGAVERRGVLERTAVVLVADHGMQRTDPDTTDHYGHVTDHIDHLDVGQGFLYC